MEISVQISDFINVFFFEFAKMVALDVPFDINALAETKVRIALLSRSFVGIVDRYSKKNGVFEILK